MKTFATPALMAIIMIYLFSSCKNTGNKETTPVPIVYTSQVTSQTEEGLKEFSFIAKPFRSSELSFRVGGPIYHFDVYAGNYYRQGEVIAEIDPRDFRIRKERTEAVYQQAKAEYERVKALYEKNNLAASVYEKAQADYVSAKTAFETAVNELADTRLIAPFNGYVGEVFIEKFQDVKATQPVISFIDIDRLKIEAYVPQEIAFQSFQPKEVELSFDARTDTTYKAQVEEISRNTTRNNLSYLLTALLPNKDGQLLAGMSGKILLQTDPSQQRNQVVIPQTALCHRPSIGNYVWVVDQETKKVNRRIITLNELLPNGKASVSEGLKAGETVAVSGLRFLSEGTSVETKTNRINEPAIAKR